MVTGLLFFIYWPISYLYFKSINDKFKIKKLYLLYFIPFIYYSATWFSFFMKTGEEKLKFLTRPNTYSSGDIISRLISYSFMILMVALMTYEYRKIKNKKHSTMMFFYFNLALPFFSILYYINFLLIYEFNFKKLYFIGFISYQTIFILPIFLVIPIFIFNISKSLRSRRNLKEDKKTLEKEESPSQEEKNPSQEEKIKEVEEKTKEKAEDLLSTEKYQMNRISEEDAKEYLEKIIKVVEAKKLYKDNNFNLTKLSKEINIPSAYISQVLNIYKGETFYNFINKYRIDLSKKMLKNPEFKRKTILSIAYESGFNSKATFNTFFKKTVGMTPSQYRNIKNTDN